MDFTQPPLWQDDAECPLEAVLRVGVVGQHAQWQIELRRADTGVLIGMASKHHFDLATLPTELELAVSDLARSILELQGPF